LKQFLSILGLGLVAISGAQVKMSIEVGGKVLGTASVTQQVKSDGSKFLEYRMDWTSGQTKMTLRSQNTYDKEGAPIRKFMEAIIPGGKMQRQIVATFDKEGANLVILDGGDRKTKQVPLTQTAPRKNKSEFWFLRDKPKVGDKVDSYVFNMDSLQWELQTATFKGTKSIEIGGKKILAHEVETTGNRKATAFLDDHGLPWLIESGSMTMRRIPEK